MSVLTQFNGGLNKRTATHLLPVNEGVEFTNIDITKGSLKSAESVGELLSESKYAYFFAKLGEWLSFAADTIYTEFNERVYYTSIDGVKMYDGIKHVPVGIDTPLSAPNVLEVAASPTIDSLPLDTYQYVYTFYSSRLGWESAPSPISESIVLSGLDLNVIELTVVKAPDHPDADLVRFYVLTTTNPNFRLVFEKQLAESIGVTVTHDLDVIQINTALSSEDHFVAEKTITNIINVNSALIGTVGRLLIWSKLGFDYVFPAENFYQFPETITGIKEVPEGIMVFTAQKTYIATGVPIGQPGQYLLTSSQGCTAHRSIQEINSIPIWSSTDGICVKNGAIIQVVSKDKLGYEGVKTSIAVVHNEVYYYIVNNKLRAYNLQYGATFIDYDLGVVSFLTVGNEKLYGYIDLQHKELFNSNDLLELIYKSPDFSDGDLAQRKLYKSFYFNCKGTFEVTIAIDEEVLTTGTITDGVTDLHIPQEEKEGYFVSFRIVGKGEVKAISYKPMSID